MSFNKLKTTLLIAIVLLIGAACGGSEPAEPAGPQPVSFTFQGSDDFQFTPPAATVQAGAQVTVTLENTGVLEHSWVLLSNRTDPAEATESSGLGGATTGIIAGGETTSVTFAAPSAAGEYTFVCAVSGHVDGGMVGTLTVE